MAASGSSTTWSRTSTSSSTSDRPLARAGALFRLVHPFPSILDGLVVAATALLAGGGAVTAVRLGLSMTALQFAIGTLNDLVDAPRDRGHLPPKPIPSGLVTVAEARVVAAIGAGIGLLAAAPSGATVGLAVVVLAIGAAYDLVAKGTPWSWLPFAVGIPILPVYGWIGATGELHPAFAAMVPMAVLAGAALALANALADIDADRAAGTRSVATALGPRLSWSTDLALMAVATAIGLAALSGTTAPPAAGVLIVGGTALVASALVLPQAGLIAPRAGWQFQAIGTAVAGVGWVAALLV